MKDLKKPDVAFIRERLLAWFEKYQRPLPWRKNYDPYQVWISEIMLQQTQVKTALPFFDRWMKALPTIRSVADADEEKILKLWEGLGYYSRARNLQKAAKFLVKENEGKMFDSYEKILTLPGVGKYTAGAIASIAFQKNHPVVDGNVIRVLARLTDDSSNTREPEVIDRLWALATRLLPSGHAREFNQGLMELGALICTPQNTKCFECPLQKKCAAFKNETVTNLPNRGEKTESEYIDVAVGVIRKGDRVFIQKRPSAGLMGGLWEFPGGKLEGREKPIAALRREISEELGITLKNIKPITVIKHAYTKFKVTLHCFSAEHDTGRVRLTAAEKSAWVKKSALKNYAFPAANSRLIDEFDIFRNK